MTVVQRLSAGLAALLFSTAVTAADETPLPKNGFPLPADIIAQSLPDLLGEGYQIIGMANQALGGAGLILRLNDRWVFCTLGTFGKDEDPQLFTVCQRISK